MLNELLCVFKGHDLRYATYVSPWETKTPLLTTIEADGSIGFIKPITTGFMHFGLIATCERCGKEIDAEDLGLPIIEPRFDT